jgi:glyceraldehyde 3-phosphate dehydrogenase
MTRIAIHGFGRIGRSTLRAALLDGRFTPAALSDVQDLTTLGDLFAVDSNYGRWPEPVSVGEGKLQIGKRAITSAMGFPTGAGLASTW